jgi:hypothetical protein
MEQCPSWEANRFSASQGIPSILWNPKVRYYIYKCPPPFLILSQLDPVHTLTFHSLKIHLNIVLLSMPGSPKWSLSHRLPHQNPVYASPLLSIRATCPAHLILLDTPEQYWWVPVTTAWRFLRLRMEELSPIWRVVANILNKQSRTSDKGCSSSLGLGEVLTTPHLKNWMCYETWTLASDLDWNFGTTWTNVHQC